MQNDHQDRLFTITGGCGFIGAHLAHALVARGDRVRILDDLSTGRREAPPADAEVIVGDVADPKAVASAVAGASGVFHLAAIASVEKCNQTWRAAHRTNMYGTVTVFEAARDAAEKPLPVTWASSAAIYGAAETMPILEDTPKQPMSPYGADKLGGEIHAAAAADLFDLPNTACRFFNVFGPGQDPGSPYSGVITIFADRLARGLPVTIHGDGGQSRDFIYVGDVVSGLIAAMDRMMDRQAAGEPARFDPINFCTGQGATVKELAEALKSLTGTTAPIIHAEPRGGDIRHSLGDATRMHDLLGIRAETSLEDGLAFLLEARARASEAAE